MKDKEIVNNVINKISDELHEEWKNIKWDLPESIGKPEIITKGVELHAQIQLLYKIIHKIANARCEDDIKCRN